MLDQKDEEGKWHLLLLAIDVASCLQNSISETSLISVIQV